MNYQDSTSVGTLRGTPRAVSPVKRRVVIIAVGVIALAVLGGLLTFQSIRESMSRARLAPNRPAPLSVTSEILTPHEMPEILSAVGSLAAITRATLSVEAGGSVTRIAFTPGAHVKKGDLLVQLNDTAEQADLANFRAQQRLAEFALGRSKQLTQSGNATRAQLDQAQSQYDVATAGIARAQAAIAKKSLRAPFEGDLGLNLVDVGEFVNPGTPVAQLSDKSRLYLHFTLPEQSRPNIAVDQPVAFTVDAFPNRQFNAKIAVIDPEVDENTRTIPVHAIAENKDGPIMPGMSASVHVDTGATPNVITVPEIAISYSLAGNTVFLATEDKGADGKPVVKAKKTAVRTGISSDGRVVVLKGLKPGDRVITSGQVKLFDGSLVTLREEAPAGTPAQPARP